MLDLHLLIISRRERQAISLFILELMSNTSLPLSYAESLSLQIECPHRQTKRQANSSRLSTSVPSTKKKLQEGPRQVARARERVGRKMKSVVRMRRGRPRVCPKSCKSRSIEDSARSRDGFIKHDGIMLTTICILGRLPILSSLNCMLRCLLLQRSPTVSRPLV